MTTKAKMYKQVYGQIFGGTPRRLGQPQPLPSPPLLSNRAAAGRAVRIVEVVVVGPLLMIRRLGGTSYHRPPGRGLARVAWGSARLWQRWSEPRQAQGGGKLEQLSMT